MSMIILKVENDGKMDLNIFIIKVITLAKLWLTSTIYELRQSYSVIWLEKGSKTFFKVGNAKIFTNDIDVCIVTEATANLLPYF